MKASSAAASKFTNRPHGGDRRDRQRPAEGQRLFARDMAQRNRPGRGARHQPVDVGVIGHVERARRARRHRDAEQRGEGGERMDMPRRRDDARPAP